MNINERLKRVRKTLGLTQGDFATNLGLKQSTIGHMEQGKRLIKDRTIILLCRTYNVNETWLREGGDDDQMFIEISDSSIIDFANEYDLDDFSKQFLISYAHMPKQKRETLITLIKELLMCITLEPTTPEPTQKEKSPPPYKWEDFDVDEETERYRQKLLEEKRQREESSALPEQRNA